MLAIAARFDKFSELGIRDESIGDLKVVKPDFVPYEFVIKAKFIAVVADLVNATFDRDKLAAR